jgi:hypothetical protein
MQNRTCLSNHGRQPQILSSTIGRGINPCLLSVLRSYPPPPYLATLWSFEAGESCCLWNLDFRYSDAILTLYCHQCHTTMDSKGEPATLAYHRAPCGWVSRHEHIQNILEREGLRAAGLSCAFEDRMLIPHTDKRPGNLFACLKAPSLSNPAPCNTATNVTIRSSRVAAHRGQVAEQPG